jgi:hypothetical protein
MAGHTGDGTRVPGSEATARAHENQINQGEVIELVEESKSPITMVPRLAGSGWGRAVTPQGHGGREREREEGVVCVRQERGESTGVDDQPGSVLNPTRLGQAWLTWPLGQTNRPFGLYFSFLIFS